MRTKNLRVWIVSGCIATATALSTANAHAAGADPTSATAAQTKDAQARLEKGRTLLAAKKYDDALVELRASFDLVASPNVHFLIARALADAGKLVEAYVEYGKTASEAKALASREGRYTQTAEAAEREQKDLAAKIAFVTVAIEHAGADTTLYVANRTIDRAAWSEPIPLMPGALDVVVSAGGKEIARQSVTLVAGDNKTVKLDGQPSNEPAKPPPTEAEPSGEPPPSAPTPAPNAKLRTYAYVAGGVGAAGLLTFAILGTIQNGTYANLKDACHNGPCPPSKADEVSTARTQQTIANVGLVVGIVGAAAGVTLFVLSMPKKTAAPSAAIVVTPGFVGLRGSL